MSTSSEPSNAGQEIDQNAAISCVHASVISHPGKSAAMAALKL
jgi:hypothetical protein